MNRYFLVHRNMIFAGITLRTCILGAIFPQNKNCPCEKSFFYRHSIRTTTAWRCRKLFRFVYLPVAQLCVNKSLVSGFGQWSDTRALPETILLDFEASRNLQEAEVEDVQV